MIRVAACQYRLDFAGSFDAWRQKMAGVLQEAADAGANLLVLPEYAGLELVSLLPSDCHGQMEKELSGLQELLPAYLDFFTEQARLLEVHIVAGTIPVRVYRGGKPVYHNRAHLFTPDGTVGFQEKLMMTRFESEDWILEPASELRVFETRLGTLGVAICYDSEFPTLVRALVEAGAEIILVPSCTDTMAGFYRVHLSCRARALENQCYVIQAPLVGQVVWLEAVDISLGHAGIFGPVDRDFPDNGVLASGSFNQAQWVYADLHLEKLKTVRADGQVLNHRDWSRLPAPLNAVRHSALKPV